MLLPLRNGGEQGQHSPPLGAVGGIYLAAGVLAASVLRLICAAAREEAPERRANEARGEDEMAAEAARRGAMAGPTENACVDLSAFLRLSVQRRWEATKRILRPRRMQAILEPGRGFRRWGKEERIGGLTDDAEGPMAQAATKSAVAAALECISCASNNPQKMKQRPFGGPLSTFCGMPENPCCSINP